MMVYSSIASEIHKEETKLNEWTRRDENEVTSEVLHQGKEKLLSFSLSSKYVMLCLQKCRVILSHQKHFNKENIY